MFARRCQIQVQGLDRLQEFKILYEDTEIKQKINELSRRLNWKVGVEKDNEN